MTNNIILRVATKLLLPFIVLFALYVQLHGHYGPGGGFQAGVIMAAAFILYALVYGLEGTMRVLPPRVVHTCMAIGYMLYAGVGVVTLFLGGNFLDYNFLDPGHPEMGQYWGVWWVELGVIITVFGTMVSVYYAFAARKGDGG